MGQNCSCIKPYQSDSNQISNEKDESKPNPDQLKIYPAEYVIFLQSLLRGYIQRKYKQHIIKNFTSSSPFSIINRENFYEITGTTPDYSNTATLAAEKKVGTYVYEEIPDDKVEVVKKNPIQIDSSTIYIGEWNNNWERHGKGVQLWSDGSKYEGYWKNDRVNGKGRLIHGDGDVYEGEWINDKANGYGIYLHSDGAKYSGYWNNDKQHGKGKEEWPDGSAYEGDYADGLKCGKGKFVWSDGSAYEGEFKDNEIDGYGVYRWVDGRVYSGPWIHNKMNGKGEFIWPDGRKYIGEYIDDKKEGFGIFVWADQRRYEGQWKNGKQNGKGVYFTENSATEGIWVDGKRLN